MEKQPDLKLVADAQDTTKATKAVAVPVDGRRQRSERSRKQIVEAMFALVREGEMAPGAARVAERAGVGLRTVFRHFDDMDSLYREMMRDVEGDVLPIIMSPYVAKDWRDQLYELVARRAKVYEIIMPLKVAAGVRRFQSQFLMDSHQRFLAMERSGLRAILPDDIQADHVLFSGLEMTLSFHGWRRMRQDQELSADEAKNVTSLMVSKLLADT